MKSSVIYLYGFVFAKPHRTHKSLQIILIFADECRKSRATECSFCNADPKSPHRLAVRPRCMSKCLLHVFSPDKVVEVGTLRKQHDAISALVLRIVPGRVSVDNTLLKRPIVIRRQLEIGFQPAEKPGPFPLICPCMHE